MKKIIFSLVLFISFISCVNAFEIDVDKIEITKMSDSLINKLDSSYKIETEGFEDELIYNKEVNELTKKLVEISTSSSTKIDKQKEIFNYMYLVSNNGFGNLTATAMIQSFVDNLDNLNIKYEYIKIIRSIKCSEGIISFAYLDDILINDEVKDMVLVYWYKEVDGEYKLYFPWVMMDDDLEEYYNKVINNENNDNTISGTYKNMSLTGNSNSVDDLVLSNLYNMNKDSNVSINGLDLSGVNSYGSGFFIREGVVVTTWSLFLEILTNSNFVYVNDCNGNSYNIEGIISADTNYDVVILKLNKEVGKKVTFSNNELKIDDKLFMISSKVNTGFSISYGSFVESNNGRLSNLFLLSNSDVGSALYDINGNVVGFNTSDILNSELSIANSSNYLIKLQDMLVNMSFNDIKTTKIDDFKNSYYDKYNDEIINNVSEDILNKYNNVVKFKDNIKLDLVKSSYKDNILSLRYKVGYGNTLNSMYYVSNFEDVLINNGYNKKLDNYDKKIYLNDKYKVIIKSNMDYLIILIMEI